MKEIKVLVYGGLGNQLFQAAIAKSLKRKFKNHKLQLLDISSYAKVKRNWALNFLGYEGMKLNILQYFFLILKIKLNNQFLKYGIANNLFNIVNESTYNKKFFDKYKNKSFILDGYWQSEKYFYDIRDEIKLSFLESRKELCLGKKEYEKVALHIRLGDYKDFNISRKNHLVCNFDWYGKAINYLYEKNNNFRFIIFTDDPDYVRNKFKVNNSVKYYIAENNKEPHIDMLRMSICDHFIISNSSYSWWASYVGENESSYVVAPKYWYPKKLTSKLGIYRSNWILL